MYHYLRENTVKTKYNFNRYKKEVNMKKRSGFEQIGVEIPIKKNLKARIKELAELHNRSLNKEVIELLEWAVISKEKQKK